MGPRGRQILVVLAALLMAGAAAGGWLWARNDTTSRVVTGPSSGGCDTTRYPPPAASSSTSTSTTSATPITTPTTQPATPTTTAAPTGAPLAPGDRGAAVMALQQRLIALGYWLGDADGAFGASTGHAVVAFQKAHGLARDGVVGAATISALSRAIPEAPRSRSGRVIEVDLGRQILLVAVDGRVQWVMDACTGIVPGSTPTGTFRVFRQVDGYDRSPLGVLYRPKYFTNGVAVHGYPLVPPQPASHGCVRITNQAMDWLWSSGAMPIGTEVWVY